MKVKFCKIIASMIFIIGLGLIIYPSLSHMINEYFAYRVILEYKNEKNEIEDKKQQEQLQEAHAYNQSLQEINPLDRTVSSIMRSNPKSGLLKEGTMLGYLVIEKIKLSIPIYYGTSKDTLLKGAGVIEHTSLPVGGLGTHAVISGHSGLPSKRMFTDLEKMKEGDLFYLNILHQSLTYRVDQIKVVTPTDTQNVSIEADKDYVTLLTCTPYGINTHRLLIRGSRVQDGVEEKELDRIPQQKEENCLWIPLLGGCIIMIICIGITIKQVRKHNNS